MDFRGLGNVTTRAEIIAEARTWIGTPWHHQATLKSVGCDCGGLIRGVMIALQLAPERLESWIDADEYLGYSGNPDGVSLREACEKYLVPIPKNAMQCGDAILVATDKYPQHLGILVDLSLIHI